MTDSIAVRHETGDSRFVISVDGTDAGFASYVEAGDVRNFNHTLIDPEFRGQGLSSPLIKYALDDSRAKGKQVQATCSAVEGFIAKHPDYASLLMD